jgi:hypothetical protein
MKSQFLVLTKDDNAITPSKMLFFNRAIKITWISSRCKGEKFQYIKLIPTNAKDPRKKFC